MNDLSLCPHGADDRFGPQVLGCRDDFDFTLLFEQSILSIGPSCLFLLVSFPRIIYLWRRSIKANSSTLFVLKLSALSCSVCLRLALLVIWAVNGSSRTRATTAATSLSLIAGILLTILSALEHSRALRPSLITNVYLIFSTLLDVVQVRTLWLGASSRVIASVLTVTVSFNVVLLTLEAVEKRSFLKAPYCNYSPEALGGIVNRTVFWWLNSLLLLGYRKILELADLFKVDASLSSEHLHSRIHNSWNGASLDSRYALLWSVLHSFKGPFSLTIFPRLCVSALRLSQPLLIDRAVSLISQPKDQNSRNVGYGLIGAAALIYFGIAAGNAHYRHRLYRTITMVRGALVFMIYDVTLKLDSDVAKDSAALTLMSTDIDRISAGIENSDHLWAALIEIAVALYLLYRQLGLPCLMPLAISILSAAGGLWVGGMATAAQKLWVDAVQKRVGLTSSMLSSMKVVKLMGLENQFADTLQEYKIIELELSKRFRRIATVRNVVSNFSLMMAPALTFAVYTAVYSRDPDGSFNPATAFTSLSIISLLSTSIQWFVIALFMFQASIGCFDRIQTYLVSKQCSPSVSLSKGPAPSMDGENDVLGGNFGDTKQPIRSFESPPYIEKSHGSKGSAMIAIDNGNFSYESNSKAVLKGISISIQQGTLNLVIGPVGCGKSTLFKAILGEMPIASGNVFVSDRSISYCSQDPWLPNQTLRTLILGSREYEEAWFSKVIDICSLREDFNRLSNGANTLVGSKGLTLSGGQKQRVALARALYSRKKIMLLDDVLSGLDSKMERNIFNNVLGSQGVCRRYSLTVILVTHAINYAPYADQVIVLTKDGTIGAQGSYEHVIAVNKTDLEAAASTDSDGSDVMEDRRSTEDELEPEVQHKDQMRASGDIRVYMYYAQNVGWFLISCYAFFQVTTIFNLKFPDIWLKWWSTAEDAAPGAQTSYYLGIYCMFGGLAICTMSVGLLTLFTGIMPAASSKLHLKLLNAVMKAPWSYFSSTDAGLILNRFSQDMSLIDMQLPIALLQTCDGLTMCVAQVILIATSSRWMSLFIPGTILVMYVLQKFYLRTSRQIRLLDLEAKTPLYSHFMESLSGLMTIRAFSWQVSCIQRHKELLDDSQSPVYLLYCIQRWLALVLDCIVAVFAVVIVTLATQLDDSSGEGANLGVALVNVLSLSQFLSYLITAWTELETSIGAVLRIRDFESDTPDENRDSGSCEQPPTQWPSAGTIEAHNLSVVYDKTTSTKPILDSINLYIPSGTRLGIIGRSGAGKSTLLHTLFRLTDVTSGQLLIDGVDISTIDRTALRRRLTVLPQHAELFPGSLRLNLDPESSYTSAQHEQSLSRVGLWDTIERRGGLHQKVDEDFALSAGERQLLALARALLLRWSGDRGTILVLDECTANVDLDTEKIIMQTVREEWEGSTVINVAHRMGTVVDWCDKVAVLDKGSLVEFGTTRELLQKEGSWFKSMVSRTTK